MKKILIILLMITAIITVLVIFYNFNMRYDEDNPEISEMSEINATGINAPDPESGADSTAEDISESDILNGSKPGLVDLQFLSSIDFDTPVYGIDTDKENKYVFVGRNYAVDIVDIQNAESIKLAGSFKKEGWTENTGWAIKILIEENYAYFAENYKLNILEIGNPLKPGLISELVIEGFDIKMAAGGDKLYMASSLMDKDWSSETSKIYSIDVLEKANPVIKNEISMKEPVYAFLKAGENLFLGGSGKLFTIEISDDGNLKLSNEIAISGWINDFEMYKNESVLLAAGSEGLSVFDITDLKNPHVESVLNIGGYGQQIELYNNKYVFMLCNSKDSRIDIAVADISKISSPELIKTIDLEGVPRQIYLAGEYLLISSTEQYEYINEDEPPQYISGNLTIYKIITR